MGGLVATTAELQQRLDELEEAIDTGAASVTITTGGSTRATTFRGEDAMIRARNRLQRLLGQTPTRRRVGRMTVGRGL